MRQITIKTHQKFSGHWKKRTNSIFGLVQSRQARVHKECLQGGPLKHLQSYSTDRRSVTDFYRSTSAGVVSAF